MSLSNNSNRENLVKPIVDTQRKRVPLKPVTTAGRSFGRVLQQITSVPEKRVIYSKPNPHERLWNPSPTKKAKARERESAEIISYDYDKENESNEISERSLGGKGRDADLQPRNTLHITEADSKVECENNLNYLRNRYIEYPVNNSCKFVPPVSSDLNNSFTEKISNLDIGFPCESPSPQGNSCQEQKDPDNPYTTEILNYWHKLEVKYSVNPNYMVKQKEVSHKMRTILVDWLTEVVEECKICTATLHRSVQFVDRFLSKLQISRNNLQLLGTTCLFIACKIEEIHPPETGDLVYLTDNTYDKAQLLRMECLILSVLDFDLMVPTAFEFSEYFSCCMNLSATAKDFTLYVIELCLLYGEKFLRFNASVTAAAACYVALRCCGGSSLEDYSIPSVLSRIKRLHRNSDFLKNVEQAVSLMFGTLMLVGSEKDGGNSVCNKYRQFQTQKYFVAAASCAACFSLPWYSVGLMTG